MSYFDSILNVADYSSFCPDTNTYPTINLDNLGSGDTYEILRIDPGNNLNVTALFNLNAGPGTELYVGRTVTGVDDEQGTVSIDLGKDKNLDAAATNYCAVTGLGNYYSQASITGHTQTALSWNLINLWYLVTICTIPFLTPSTSADDYTVSNYFNLLLITVTSLSQSCPSTLSCFLELPLPYVPVDQCIH